MYRALLLSRIIIAAGIRWVVTNSGTQNNLPDDANQADKSDNQWTVDSDRYYIDESIRTQWKISRSSWSLEFTHVLATDDGNTIALKSADLNLFDYGWEVQIKWVVVDFADDQPIVQVAEIISTLVDQNTWNQDEANEQFRYLQDSGIAIDLSSTPSYSINNQDDSILLVDTSWQLWDDNNVVLSITPFVCNNADGLQDCDGIKDSFKITNPESFTTSNWVTLSNMPETSNWMMFQWNMGYYVRPVGGTSITDFADMILFLDDDTLSQEIKDKANTSCRTLEYRIWQNISVDLGDVSNNKLTATASWTSNSDTSKTIICNYQVTIDRVRNIKLLSATINDDGTNNQAIDDTQPNDNIDSSVDNNNVQKKLEIQDKENEAEESNEANENETIVEDSNKAKVIEEWEYAGRLAFPSSRWYTTYFSDRSIGYAWAFLPTAEQLTIWDTDCTYGIKVTKYTNIDNIQTAPDSIIYECAGPIELWALPDGVSYVTEFDGRSIIKKDITDVLVGMEVWISGN